MRHSLSPLVRRKLTRACTYYEKRETSETVSGAAKRFGVSAKTLSRWLKDRAVRRPTGGSLVVLSGYKTKEELRHHIETNLLFLARDVLGYRFDPETKEGINNPPDLVHLKMAELRERPQRFTLGVFPRFTYKTTFLTICGAIQDLCQDPENTVMIYGEHWNAARRSLMEIKHHLIYNEVLKKCYGTFRPVRDPDLGSLWNRDWIYIAQRRRNTPTWKQPSIITAGRECEVTGQHPDIVYVDDPTGAKTSQTYEQKQKVIARIKQLISLAGSRGRLRINGTPWAMDDAIMYVISEWIGVRDGDTGQDLFAHILMGIDDADGHSIMPSKTTDKDIETLKATLSAYEFACQWKCRPASSGATLVSKEALLGSLYDAVDFDKFPQAEAFILIDPGSSIKAKNCWTGIVAVVYIPPYDIYVDEAIKLKLPPTPLLDETVKIFQRDPYLKRMRRSGMEEVGFQNWYGENLRARLRELGHAHIRVMPCQPTAGKPERISWLEPLFRHGQIHLRRHTKDLQYQVANYPHLSDNDRDLVDALAYARQILPKSFRLKVQGVAPVKTATEVIAENIVRETENPEKHLTGFCDYRPRRRHAQVW